MQEILETKVQLLQEVHINKRHINTHSLMEFICYCVYKLELIFKKDQIPDSQTLSTFALIWFLQLRAFPPVCVAFRRPCWPETRLSGWPRWRTLRLSAAWLWRERCWRGWRRVEAQTDCSPSRPWPTKTGDFNFTFTQKWYIKKRLWPRQWLWVRSLNFTPALTRS